jgi:magnesium chelatase family protein
MALARSWSVSLVGLEGHVVQVEADLAQGIPGLSITGLPDASLNEARDRVRAAIANSGQSWPVNKRITIGLSPASLPKRGSGFDIAMAAAVLAANGTFPPTALEGLVLLGELGLDGSIRGVAGVLPAVLEAQRCSFERVVVPLANLAEAQLVPGISAQGSRACAACSTCCAVRPGTSWRRPLRTSWTSTRWCRTSPRSSGSPAAGWPARSPRRAATTC